MGGDSMDMIYLQHCDPTTPVEETFSELEDLIR